MFEVEEVIDRGEGEGVEGGGNKEGGGEMGLDDLHGHAINLLHLLILGFVEPCR